MPLWERPTCPVRNEQLKAMAEEYRRLAFVIQDEVVRSRLPTVAEHFDRLADPHRVPDIVAAFRPADES